MQALVIKNWGGIDSTFIPAVSYRILSDLLGKIIYT